MDIFREGQIPAYGVLANTISDRQEDGGMIEKCRYEGGWNSRSHNKEVTITFHHNFFDGNYKCER